MTPEKSISLPTRAVPLADIRPHFSRQILRRTGYGEILAGLKQKFPNASRSEIRKLARQANKDSWDIRDKEAVAKLIHPEVAK